MEATAAIAQPDPLLPPHRPSARPPLFPTAASKYDFVKVRVWLPGGQSYILSRFLVARMLTAAAVVGGGGSQNKAPPGAAGRPPSARASILGGASGSAAVRAALALKKRLVDAGRLDVSQAELQAELFSVLEEGEGGEGGGGGHDGGNVPAAAADAADADADADATAATHPTPPPPPPGAEGSALSPPLRPTSLAALPPRDRFAAVARFFAARRPLVVLLCTPPLPCGPGAGLGRDLAARLNLPPAVQADLLAACVEGGEGGGAGGGVPAPAPAGPPPWWAVVPPHPGPSAPSALAGAFLAQAAALAAALGPDLARGVWDGKALVLEGCALDPLAFAAAVGVGSGREGKEGEAAGGRRHQPPPPPIILPVLVRLTDADRALLAWEACERDPVRLLRGEAPGGLVDGEGRAPPLLLSHPLPPPSLSLSLPFTPGPRRLLWRAYRPGVPAGRPASLCGGASGRRGRARGDAVAEEKSKKR